ncbi:glycosyl hydrolase [Pedobacter sp.]|uniref:glycosyl hydrolase n=1 Tax=Pedobacter sp. TaxID=1411316 RepID=UPI003BAC3C68
MKKEIISTLTAAFFLSLTTLTSAQSTWPELTSQNRPWGRWWWQGSAVTKADISWNLQQYQSAGLGGMEITPIYGVKGTETQFIPFLSASWIDMLQYTVAQAKGLNMGIDLANATGWPFGGPWVMDSEAGKEIFWKTYTLKSGEKLTEPIQYTQSPLLIQAGQRVGIKEIKQPLSSNANLQQMAIDQIRFPQPAALMVLMAYTNKGMAIDLTSKVSTNGNLAWTAPDGDWKLYALFSGFHGKLVERAAPGGEGYVIDHFSKPAIMSYLKKFSDAFAGNKDKGVRAYFNDSYEVDDAQGQANFTPLLFDEFIRRRGYDLRKHLPALLSIEPNQSDKQVLHDYRQTISELMLENFTKPWQAWASGRKKLIRNQAHGSPANILDLYAASDIPETEGNGVMGFKFASSAAHVSGKPLVSTESGTWFNEHFMTTLAELKQSADRCFIGGVNHLFYHGVNYSPKDAKWPGWLFYAAVNFVPNDPFWRDFGTLNNYIARCQSFLQQGSPDNDVLLYLPISDSFMEKGEGLLRHYHDMQQFNGTGFENVAKQMLAKGFAFDFISDRQVINLKQGNSFLLSGEARYKTLVLPAVSTIPVNTLESIIELARKGARVIVYDKLPTEPAGFDPTKSKQSMFKALMKRLQFDPVINGVKRADIGKGAFFLGEDIPQLMQAAGVMRETMTDNGLEFTRRGNPDGKTYFIVNQGQKTISRKITLNTSAVSATLFNPMTRQLGAAPVIKGSKGTEVFIELQAGESCIIKTSAIKKPETKYAFYESAGNAIALKGEWRLKFLKGGPQLPPPVTLEKLEPWTDSPAEAYQAFSGEASYSTTFNKPSGLVPRWRLSVDKAFGSIQVHLNGKNIGTLLGPQFTIDLNSAQLQPTNTLEIRVVNSMANRIIDMEKKGISYKNSYNVDFQAREAANRGKDGKFTAKHWKPLSSGLSGTVSLMPLKTIQINP